MYNIQKAVSRLDYAPKLKEIELTDIKKGLGEFTPKPEKPVSFAALKATLKSAGYVLDAADISVAGTLDHEGESWVVVIKPSGQKFVLEGPNAVTGLEAGSAIEITGDWKTIGKGNSAREVITPTKKIQASRRRTSSDFSFISATFVEDLPVEPSKPLAPIRVTSPGLTVYKGGAITPRVYFIRQHLGALKVNRQMVDVSLSYTP